MTEPGRSFAVTVAVAACLPFAVDCMSPSSSRPGQYSEIAQRGCKGCLDVWIRRNSRDWVVHRGITRPARPPTLSPSSAPHLQTPWVLQRAHRQAWPSQVQTSTTSTTVLTKRSSTKESFQSSQSPIWKTLAGATSARSSPSRIKWSMRPQNAPWPSSSMATGLASKSA